MNDKLKPCPFCGGMPFVDYEHNFDTMGCSIMIGCDICMFRIEKCFSPETKYISEELMAQQWNNRPVEDDLRLQIEKLKNDYK